jgi:glycolate oxidase
MIVMDETQLAGQTPTLDKAVDGIYEYAISLGGVISGEHGIGSLQKPYLKWQFSPTQLSLMRRLKSFFDPNGILNPGKIL